MKPERFPPAEALRAISRKLGGLARSTERDFMAVGGKLESILTRAGEAVAAVAGCGGGKRGGWAEPGRGWPAARSRRAGARGS